MTIGIGVCPVPPNSFLVLSHKVHYHVPALFMSAVYTIKKLNCFQDFFYVCAYAHAAEPTVVLACICNIFYQFYVCFGHCRRTLHFQKNVELEYVRVHACSFRL